MRYTKKYSYHNGNIYLYQVLNLGKNFNYPMAALIPMNTMVSHPSTFMLQVQDTQKESKQQLENAITKIHRKEAHQIEREPTAVTASSRLPVRMMRLIKYQISRHSITADERDSLTKAHISLKASQENPFQPSLHQTTT